MTFIEGQQPAVDPEASLRIELTGAIASAQIDIANAIAELARIGADSSALTNQSQALQHLQRTVGSANLGNLLALRGEVVSTASSATALANQAINTATNAAAAYANLSPSERAHANIEALNRDLFENRVLDPYLRFNSPADEEAYRKRERERKEEIDRERAKGTVEGYHRALELTKDQLRDAGAHGADRSPDYADMVERANAATADLQAAREKPKEAMERPNVSTIKGEQPTPSEDGLADILATLKAAGVTTPANQASEAGHGVKVAAVAAHDGAAPVRGS